MPLSRCLAMLEAFPLLVCEALEHRRQTLARGPEFGPQRNCIWPARQCNHWHIHWRILWLLNFFVLSKWRWFSINIDAGPRLCPGCKFWPTLYWSPVSSRAALKRPSRHPSLSTDCRLYRQNQATFHCAPGFSGCRLQAARRGATSWRPCLSLPVWLHTAHVHVRQGVAALCCERGAREGVVADSQAARLCASDSETSGKDQSWK